MKSFIIIVYLLISYNLYGQNVLSYNYEEIEGKDLKGSLVKTDELMDPNYLMFVDSMLIIRNRQTEYHFDLLNLENGHIISRFCRKGRGPGEIIYPLTFQIIPEKNLFMTYDLNLRRVNFYDFKLILDNKPDNYIRSFKIDSTYARNVLLLENGKYLCPIIGDNAGDNSRNKFCMLAPDGKYLGMIGTLPDIGVSYPTLLSSIIFDYWVGINNKRDKIVLAYDHWDRLEVINTYGEAITIIKGPKFKKTPGFVVKGQNISITWDNPLSYCIPCLSEKSFMVIYSGEKMSFTRSYSTALLFDYDGKLLAKYNLNPSVKRIAVDWENRIIYGVNTKAEPSLYEYKF